MNDQLRCKRLCACARWCSTWARARRAAARMNDECALSARCKDDHAFPAAFVRGRAAAGTAALFAPLPASVADPGTVQVRSRRAGGRGSPGLSRRFAGFVLCRRLGAYRAAWPRRAPARSHAAAMRSTRRGGLRAEGPGSRAVGCRQPHASLFRQPQRTPACRRQRLRVGCRGRPARPLRARSGLGRAARRASRSDTAQSDGLRALSCMHA